MGESGYNDGSMRFFLNTAFASVAIVCASLLQPAEAPAQSSEGQRVVVTVNDQPITNYDISQRIRLNDILGAAQGGSDAQRRKEALQDLIDDVVKRSEAKKSQLEPTDKQVEEAVAKLAKNMSLSTEGLEKSLRGKGVSMSALRNHVKASLGFNWIMTRKHNIKVEVDKGEVDKRYASISSDPRLKPVEVMRVIEIDLPVEDSAGAMADQLMYARAVEAQQIIQRYKGCGSLRQATEGIFNVKIGKTMEAAGDQLPPEMRSVLLKAGTTKLIGPMRGKGGVQLIAFCGSRSVAPQKPSREVVEDLVRNEKYRVQSERLLRDLRRTAFIDYKDRSLTQ